MTGSTLRARTVDIDTFNSDAFVVFSYVARDAGIPARVYEVEAEDTTDPAMVEAWRDDNRTRAGNAAIAVAAYTDALYHGGEEPQTVFSDLLGDLRHLADALGFDWDDLDRRGDFHYQAEIRGEL